MGRTEMGMERCHSCLESLSRSALTTGAVMMISFWSKGGLRFRILFRPSVARMRPTSLSRTIPTLDLTNPIQISTGNIYLRPQFTHNAFLSYRTGNPKDFSFAEIFLTASLNNRQIVQASWFDESGAPSGR